MALPRAWRTEDATKDDRWFRDLLEQEKEANGMFQELS